MIYSKLFKNIVAVVMVVAATLFVGCSKENNAEQREEYEGSPIVGRWSATFKDDEGGLWSETYDFKANGRFVLEYKSNQGEEDGVSGTYTYKEPILNLYYYETDDLMLTATVSISGNVLTLTNCYDGSSEVYYRQ